MKDVDAFASALRAKILGDSIVQADHWLVVWFGIVWICAEQGKADNTPEILERGIAGARRVAEAIDCVDMLQRAEVVTCLAPAHAVRVDAMEQAVLYLWPLLQARQADGKGD